MAADRRTLLLLRHAKSSWDDPATDDFDRPLAPRGLDAGPLIGREIARRGWIPDAALVSSARRTRDTFMLVTSEWPGKKPDTRYSERIYEADPSQILAEIRSIADDVAILLVVGHNPGLQALAVQLASAQSDHEGLGKLTAKFPTAALARFDLEGRWQYLRAGTARLTHFLRPRDLS